MSETGWQDFCFEIRPGRAPDNSCIFTQLERAARMDGGKKGPRLERAGKREREEIKRGEHIDDQDRTEYRV